MVFRVPQKAILEPDQLAYFQTSKTYQDLVSYIESLNDAVVGVKLADECTESPGVKAILDVLLKVEQIARDTPPVENAASRFGNPAFRTFYDKVSETIDIPRGARSTP
ncbi:putative PPIases accelerate the folding of proteins [Lyophyllum shimeji]|uniref:Serine/threonine-protein phosphatase 2A activator n=1 Tax=Lyophyllum shimeji TaxID=47721 RepID=A0A9P3PR28_LYOSH|nr:putative PPIases accelerate the folding of proteins [Lyophyllum shimeji]